jgi:hypothetical protein
LLTDVRIFSRVVAGVIGYAWSVYLATQGRALLASFETPGQTMSGTAKGLGLAYLIPALLSVVAVWAAAVAEEGILWAMSIGLVIFGVAFVSEGGLLLSPVAVGHLVVVALSRPPDRVRNLRRPRRPIRRSK